MKWTIYAQEGYCNDYGMCEPYAAAEAIKQLEAKKGRLSKEQIEKIAKICGCKVKWEDDD